MSEYPEILYEVQERIATTTLNRPERLNAYTGKMASSIKRAMAEANNDPQVRVIIITGSGRGFCAGADMDILSGHTRSEPNSPPRRDPSEIDSRFHSPLGPNLDNEFHDAERFGYFVKAKKPIIAAINGPIAGIGLVMALYADIRFAAANAVFTTSFSQRGLIAEHGMSWLLPRIVGQANALDLVLSARKINADEAYHMGLVNKVLSQETFMEGVHAYARILADTVSPRSMAVMKAQLWKANFQDFNEALAVADEEMKASLVGPEFKEGVAHFLEKRAPRFADI